jgi:hypothetical protein
MRTFHQIDLLTDSVSIVCMDVRVLLSCVYPTTSYGVLPKLTSLISDRITADGGLTLSTTRATSVLGSASIQIWENTWYSRVLFCSRQVTMIISTYPVGDGMPLKMYVLKQLVGAAYKYLSLRSFSFPLAIKLRIFSSRDPLSILQNR